MHIIICTFIKAINSLKNRKRQKSIAFCLSANLAKRELVLHWRKPVGKIYIVLYDYRREGGGTHYLGLARIQTASESTKL